MMNKQHTTKQSTHLKKVAAIVLASTLAAAGTTASLPGLISTAQAAASTSSSKSVIHVQVEGKAIKTEGMLSKNGKTMLPLKDAAKALGASVAYDAKNHAVNVTKGNKKVSYELFTYGTGNASNSVFVSMGDSEIGDTYDADVVKGTSYVEVKALTEAFGYRALWNNSTRTVNVTSQGINDVTITSAKYEPASINKYTDLNIVYPVVSGLENEAAQTAINKAIKARTDQFVAAMKKQVAEIGKPYTADIRYEIDSGYKVTYNQNGVISFLLTDYEYLGGAHGDSVLTGMTFSLKDGKPVALNDLLKSNTNYRQDLKKLLQTQIKKNSNDMGYSLDQFNDLTKNSSKYLENYYLTDSGFTIFFQKYDIAPGAAGNPEFDFIFSQILKSGTTPLKAYN